MAQAGDLAEHVHAAFMLLFFRHRRELPRRLWIFRNAIKPLGGHAQATDVFPTPPFPVKKTLRVLDSRNFIVLFTLRSSS